MQVRQVSLPQAISIIIHLKKKHESRWRLQILAKVCQIQPYKYRSAKQRYATPPRELIIGVLEIKVGCEIISQ